MTMDNCIFCKTIKKEIPSDIIIEGTDALAFMDINPVSPGHCLFIQKKNAIKLHEIDDNANEEILGLIKKVAKAASFDNYNILQNNGAKAGQEVMHAHFHLIPRIDKDGLSFRFNHVETDQAKIAQNIRNNL